MKKRILTLVLSSCMLIGLAGCGKSTSNTSTAPKTSTASESPANPKSAWPKGDVKIIVPNPAGGASDMSARLFADYVSKNSGKNVIVINETGGSNTVGFETVRNAKKDGSTLLSFHGTALLNYHAGKINYSLMDESSYTFINFIYEPMETSVNCVAVGAKSPYKTIEDLLEAARTKPGTISCGDGFGSAAAIITGQMELATGVKFKHVDAPDTTTRITNVIGGQIDWAPLGYMQAVPYVKSGDIRLLAMDGSVMFDKTVPTFESLGYSGIGFPSFGFVAGPANMDAAVIAAIDAWSQEFCVNSKKDVEKLGFTTNVWTRKDAIAKMSEIDKSLKEVTKNLGW